MRLILKIDELSKRFVFYTILFLFYICLSITTVNGHDLKISSSNISCGPDNDCNTTNDNNSEKVKAGETINYTTSYENIGTDSANNAYIIGKIPPGVCYKVNSLEPYLPSGTTLLYSNDSVFSFPTGISKILPVADSNGTDCNITAFKITHSGALKPSNGSILQDTQGEFGGTPVNSTVTRNGSIRLQAQTNFTSATLNSGDKGFTNGFEIIDIDGDGDKDLVAAGTNSPTYVYRQTTPGNFTEIQISSGNTIFPGGVTIADIDSDGDKDIIAGGDGFPTYVYFQQSNLSFNQTQISTGNTNFRSKVKVADMDKDNKLDIIGGGNGGYTTIFYRLTASTFTTQNVSSTQTNFRGDIEVIDIDNDNDLDIVGGGYFGKTYYFKQTATRSFQEVPLSASDTIFQGGVAIANIDNDSNNLPDIIGGGFFGDSYIYKQTTPGNFTEILLPGGATRFYNKPIIVDINADGDQDIVAGGYGRPTYLYNQDSNNNFQRVQISSDDTYFYSQLKTIDIDADSDIDIVGLGFNDHSYLFSNNGDGTFSQTQLTTVIANFIGNFEVIDINKDSHLDVLGGSDAGKSYYLINNGQNVFTQFEFTNNNTYFKEGIKSVDIDGDGDEDILGAGDGGPSYKFTNNTTYSANGTYTTIINPGYNVSAWNYIEVSEVLPTNTSIFYQVKDVQSNSCGNTVLIPSTGATANRIDLTSINPINDAICIIVSLATTANTVTPELSSLLVDFDMDTNITYSYKARVKNDVASIGVGLISSPSNIYPTQGDTELNNNISKANLFLEKITTSNLSIEKDSFSCGNDNDCSTGSDNDYDKVKENAIINYIVKFQNLGDAAPENTEIIENIPDKTCYMLNSIESLIPQNFPAYALLYSNDEGLTWTYRPTGTTTDCMVTTIKLNIQEQYKSQEEYEDFSDVEKGLVGYWKFDEESGNYAYDASGYNNTVKLLNGASFTTGKINSAMNMDGSNDLAKVDHSQSLNITGSLTISGWIKLNNLESAYMIEKTNIYSGYGYGGYALLFTNNTTESDGNYRFCLIKTSGSGGTGGGNYGSNTNWDRICTTQSSWETNKWYHITATWDGTTNTDSLKIYVNGKEMGKRKALQRFILSNTQDLYLASRYDPVPYIGAIVNGQVDDIRIYNRSLNAQEVNLIYNRMNFETSSNIGITHNTLDKGLIAHYKLDNPSTGSGSTALDSSGNNLNGTLMNGPAWTTGKLINGLRFDGTDDYVEIPDNDKLSAWQQSGEMTVCSWVKLNAWPTGGQERAPIIAKGTTGNNWEYALYVTGSSNKLFQFLIWNSAGTTYASGTTPINTVLLNQWYYVCGVFDNDAVTNKYVRMYVNGILNDDPTAGTTLSGTLKNGTSPVNLGRRPDNATGQKLNGIIDDTRIYNRALSSEEINNLYKAGTNFIDLENGLVSYWKFEESASPSIDSSTNAQTGSWSGNTSVSNGKYRNAVSMDGTGDYITVADNSSQEPDSITLSGWISTNSLTQDDWIISKQTTALDNKKGYLMRIDNVTSSVFCSFGNGATTGATTVTPFVAVSINTWYHVSCTYQNGKAKIYLNGALAGEGNNTSTLPIAYEGVGDMYIGGHPGNAGYTVNGRIDEVRIYNKALSNSEILALYNYTPPPVARWQMNEETGNIVYDSSGNGLNLTLQNNPNRTVGKYMKSIYFDGVDDYLSVADTDLLDLSANFSLSGWVKFNSLSNIQMMLGKGRVNNGTGYNLGWDSGQNTFAFGICSLTGSCVSAYNTSITAKTGEWYYLTGTYDGSNMNLYVNGTLIKTQAASSATYAPGNSTQPLIIGNEATSLSRFVKGNIDDVRIYDYVLTPAQIMEDMLNTPRKFGTESYDGKLNINNNLFNTDFSNGGINFGSSGTKANAAIQVLNTTTSKSNIFSINNQASLDGLDDYLVGGAGNISGSIDIKAKINPTIPITKDIYADGLQAYWNFDENTDTVANDISGYNNTAILSNGPVWAKGKYNNSLSFDGIDDIVDSGKDFSWANNEAFTISAWINPKVAPASAGIIGKGTTDATWEYSLFMQNDKFRFTYWNTSGANALVLTGPAITLNNWYHVVVTYNGTTGSLFLDGSLVSSSSSIVGTFQNRANNLNIGRAYPAAGFVGQIDEVKVYNYALTQPQVYEDMANSRNIVTGGTIISKGDNYELNLNPVSTNNWTLPYVTKSGFSTGAITNQLNGTAIYDVFWYDTTLDSDYGTGKPTDPLVWRFASTKSWYTENIDATYQNCNLNSHDRCGTREFPEKAYIVAVDNALYIFDAQENAMWMRFDVKGNSPVRANTTAVIFLDGKMYVGHGGTPGNSINTINFINDSWYHRNNNTTYVTQYPLIAQRNQSGGVWTSTGGPGILSPIVNDVSVDVINNKTYVAVATAGGVSIINETDNVVKNFGTTTFAGGTVSNSVFLTQKRLYFTQGTSGGQGMVYKIETGSNEWLNGKATLTSDNVLLGTYGYSTIWPGIPNWINNKSLYVTENTSTIDRKSNTIYISATAGELNPPGGGAIIVQEKQGDDTNGSVKFITKDYVTEEMIGDIRGMWGFATKNNGTAIGASVSNNDEIDDYSVKNSDLTVVSDAGGMATEQGVRGSALTFDGTNDYLKQKTYLTGTQTARVDTAGSAAVTIAGLANYATTSQPYNYMLVSTNCTTVGWGYLGAVLSGDNLKVFNSKTGTTQNWVTVPSGGTCNSFEIRKTEYQITDSITLGAWVKGTSSTAVILSKFSTGGASNNSYMLRFESGKLQFIINNITLSSNKSINDNNWHHVLGVYDGNVSKVYIDGELDGTLVLTGAITDSRDVLYLGARSDGTSMIQFLNGSIDEPFITAEALSAEQIKNMYEIGRKALEEGPTRSSGASGSSSNSTSAITAYGLRKVGVSNYTSSTLLFSMGSTGNILYEFDLGSDSLISSTTLGNITKITPTSGGKNITAGASGIRRVNDVSGKTSIMPNTDTIIRGYFDKSDGYYKLYENDIEVGRTFVDKTNTPQANTDMFNIGAKASGNYPGNFFAGSVKSVDLWKTDTSGSFVKVISPSNDFNVWQNLRAAPDIPGGSDIQYTIYGYNNGCNYSNILFGPATVGGLSRISSITSLASTLCLKAELYTNNYKIIPSLNSYGISYSSDTQDQFQFRSKVSLDAGGTGPIAHWMFDETSGTTASDSTTNGNTGTLTNGPTWSEGRLANALNFDGNDDFVNVPDSASLGLTGNMTISMWINPSASQKQYATILSKHLNGGFVIEQNSNNVNQYYFAWDTTGSGAWTGSAATTTLAPNKWQQLTIVKNGTVVTHYLDGVQTATTTGSNATIATNSLALKIGDMSSTAGRQFKGLLDDIKIYNRALSASEISSNYTTNRIVNNIGITSALSDPQLSNNNAEDILPLDIPAPDLDVSLIGNSCGTTGTCTLSNGLVGYWKMDTASLSNGSQVADYSTNRNDATLVNGPIFVEGKNDKGMGFDGIDDYIYTQTQPNIGLTPNTFTVSGFIKPNNLESFILTPRSNGYDNALIYNNTSQRLRLNIVESPDTNQRNRYSTVNSVPIGQWTHFAVIIQDKVIKIYINGILDSQYTETINIANWSGIWDIGRRGNNSSFYSGLLDDIRIYNRAISDNEARSLAQIVRPSEKIEYKVNIDKINTVLPKDYEFIDKIPNNTCFSVGSLDASLLPGTTVLYSTDDVPTFPSNPAYTPTANSEGLDCNITAIKIVYSDYSYGLVSHWKFDESSWNGTTGEVKDLGIYRNNGTAVGGTTTTAGKFGNGGVFDGTDDYIMSTNTINLVNDQTYSVWIKPATVSSSLTGVFTTHNHNTTSNIGINLYTNLRVSIGYQDGTREYSNKGTQYNLVPGQWTHAVLVYRLAQNRIEFYINGEFDSGWNLTKPVKFTPQKVVLGRWSVSYLEQYKFQGVLDEARIYNRALSALEIKALSSFAPGPSAYWNMDEGGGSTIYDGTGESVSGTLTNSPTWVQGKYGKALDFNGSTQYATVIQNSSLCSANQTFAVWFNIDTYPSSDYSEIVRLEGANGYYLSYYPYTNMWDIGFRDNIETRYAVAVPRDLTSPGKWNHIAATLDDSSVKVYINGVLYGTTAYSGTRLSSCATNHLFVGAYGTNTVGGRYFDGKIDEVKIYKRALSSSEISNLYWNSLYDFNFTVKANTDLLNINQITSSITGNPATQRNQIETITSNNTSTNILEVKYPAELSGKVWNDLNADGIQNNNEPAVNGRSLLLYLDNNQDGQPDGSSIASVSSATDSVKGRGYYIFENLNASNKYIIGLNPTDTTTITLQNTGPFNQNNDFSNITRKTGTLTVDLYNPRKDIDLGLIGNMSIAGTVWEDLDNSGNIDSEDITRHGIKNLTLKLYEDSNNDSKLDGGDMIVNTLSTNDNGLYNFEYLLSGKYFVVISSQEFSSDGPLMGCKSSDDNYPAVGDYGRYTADGIFSGQINLTPGVAPDNSGLSYLNINFGIVQGKAPFQNWLQGWAYRIPVTIQGNTSNLTDFQIPLEINTQAVVTANKMLNDCRDIRFTDSDQKTVLNYWVEGGCNTTITRIWTKVPSLPSGGKAIYLYYGNPAAVAQGNGSNTFEFFDDFNDNVVDTGKWQMYQGTWVETAGILSQTDASTQGNKKAIMISAPQGDNYAISAKVRPDGASNVNERTGVGLKTNLTNGLGYNFVFRNNAAKNQTYFLNDSVAWGSTTSYSWALGNWYRFEMAAYGGNLYGQVWLSGTSAPVNWQSTQNWSGLNGYPALNGGYYTSGLNSFDDVFVRKTSTLPPTASLGSESAYN